jgi:hypothetical protein
MTIQSDNPWKKLSSKVAYQSPLLTAREDKVVEVFRMVPGGKLTDGQSLGALLYLKLWLEK